ncbi:MAG: hypothetical protein IH629_05330, partial [Thermoleophilia bacterium]|nr:hypothetical protein [Thermoleophilia bacterium]
QATVYEAGLATGSNPSSDSETTIGTIDISAKDGLTSVTIGGTEITQAALLNSSSVNITINTGEGTLVINGFTPTDSTHADGSGTINYTYTLNAQQAHATGAGNNEFTDTIALIVTDRNSDTANGTLTVTIIDDVPTAVADGTTTLVENGVTVTHATEGNLLTNDTIGADATGAYINQITYINESDDSATATIASGGSVTVDTKNGSLTVYSDGRWSFTSDTTVVNTLGAPLSESFTYRLRDGDGDTSSATKTFSITDTSPSIGVPVDAVVYEASLPTGTNPSATTEAASQTLGVIGGGDTFDTTFDAPIVLSNLKSGGHDVTYSVSPDGHTLTASANGNTVFTVVITDPTANSAGYTFTLVRPLDHTSLVDGLDGTIDLPFT